MYTLVAASRVNIGLEQRLEPCSSRLLLRTFQTLAFVCAVRPELLAQAPWETAIAAAIRLVEAQDKDVRVLNIGAGAGKPHLCETTPRGGVRVFASGFALLTLSPIPVWQFPVENMWRLP